MQSAVELLAIAMYLAAFSCAVYTIPVPLIYLDLQKQ
jgi:hypothetical protein